MSPSPIAPQGPIFDYRQGSLPILVTMPHSGVELCRGLAERLDPSALSLPDTDWHIPELYHFIEEMGAYRLTAHYSRFVIDLNRPPDNQALYPGQAGTDLCPLSYGNGHSLYRPHQEPDKAEIAERLALYWQPFHHQIAAVLAEIRARFGYALLYDAHSIPSQMPILFEGILTDLNLGTARGASMAPQLREDLQSELAKLAANHGYSQITDGRFVGGYITRHYGQPAQHVHALQMELSQRQYMDEVAPYRYRADKAQYLQPLLTEFMQFWLNQAKLLGHQPNGS